MPRYFQGNRLDTTPYKTDYVLIKKIDEDQIKAGRYHLRQEQFGEIVANFQYGAKKGSQNQKIKQLAMNILSIHTQDGLYVLAYRKLRLDVQNRMLRQDDDITICMEFSINGNVQSIRKFLDAEDFLSE